jgi:hypothetical protein
LGDDALKATDLLLNRFRRTPLSSTLRQATITSMLKSSTAPMSHQQMPLQLERTTEEANINAQPAAEGESAM